MPDLKTIVADRLKDLDLKPIPAAEAVGLERGFIRDIITGRKKSVGSDKMPLLARALRLDASQLAMGESMAIAPDAATPPDTHSITRAPMPRDVPVFGTVAGSSVGNGSFQLTPGVVDYVGRPPGLQGARDVYALYVQGESMQPRFYPGDLVFVHPHRPVRVGDVVIIQEPDTDNGRPVAFIKVFKRRNAVAVVAEQLNPFSTLEFRRSGTKVHKVLTMNELFGV